MKTFFLLSMTVAFFTTDVRADFERTNTTTERLSDRGLIAAHELLYTGMRVSGCEVSSSIAWNGSRYSLSVLFTSDEDEDIWLDFTRSTHITSRVKIKHYWFSSAVREISFETVSLQSVPRTRKDVIRISLERSGRPTEIVYETYLGSEWNLTKRISCK